jgi:Histidine kinase-, DNA gyrase B-, and HSP90-like ATPase
LEEVADMRKRPTSFIVDESKFIFSAREVGYRSPGDAIAELVDNALQAQARTIKILTSIDHATRESGAAPEIAVFDDGKGMNANTLRKALQFGGTTRFNDRSGLGRFGMGLPSCSVSQARRVEVYTWDRSRDVIYSYLDVDDVAEGRTRQIPVRRLRALPAWARQHSTAAGTLVVWRKCDRLTSNWSVGENDKLSRQLGRIFRYFIWSGVKLFLNGSLIAPIDPLFCNPNSPLGGAIEYGKPLTYRFRLPDNSRRTATISVRFSELPIAKWHDLSNQDKRRFGITKGSGVSLLRAGREVAYGWFFMGTKRRENYDDWWRCEVSFEPELDEYFRPNYTKQSIHPVSELVTTLTLDLESIARNLNSRVRQKFFNLKSHPITPAASRASRKEKYLSPIARNGGGSLNQGQTFSPKNGDRKCRYRLCVGPLQEDAFYSLKDEEGTLVLTLNQDHPFFERIYAPLCKSVPRGMRINIDCLLFALARTEAEAISPKQRYWYNRKRIAWSNTLAAFLGS